MALSDDEEEVVVKEVTNFHFVDGDESPISFAVLPLQFGDGEKADASKKDVFLHGTSDDGLQKIYQQVTAYKLGFDDEQPDVSVLSKDGRWIRLLKPRKSYEDSIRTIMIAVQMLHFLRRNPEATERSLWDHLSEVFDKFEARPSEDDFRDHVSLITLFSERDEILAKSQILSQFLRSGKRFSEDRSNIADVKQPFIAADDEVDETMEDGDESEEESELFDSVCAICDNGGELLCCDGECMRSFHATKKSGEESECRSLGYTKAQVEAIQSFLCKNCEYKQHQCFICLKLDCSDKLKDPKVFQCANATCGYFYHPKCVTELLYPGDASEASDFEKRIASGMSFTCPVHKCAVCKKVENKDEEELQFAVCRRCPKSYHRKCLPSKIAFDDNEEEGIIQRAWEDLLPNRILIYCLKHKIDEDLGTPIRNHVKFPDDPEKKKIIDAQKQKIKGLVNKRREDSDKMIASRSSEKKLKLAEKISGAEKSQPVERTPKNRTEQIVSSLNRVKASKGKLQTDVQKVEAGADSGVKYMKGMAKPKTPAATSTGKILRSSFPVIDNETEKRVVSLLEKVSSSLTLDDVTRKLRLPSTHAYSSRNIEKTITRGKVEGSVEAIQTALEKLEGSGNVEDAKAICEPEIVKRLVNWNNKLKVYLAPFIHGMRYTSFGRHFTKEEKLKEIVDKLQLYVQTGDTIVDFCCGSNDFCKLMKETLDAAGKKCNFKNYDLIRPKNDFCFEKRDWMKVQTRELPTGSQLIMGLNPPFGVKASLANKFIDKALTFKPKLIILIVPQETERLDQKNPPYDLIWEDGRSLSGKSFYLPGSVDVNDKQIDQWNLSPPLLYLWSRSDWTLKHKAVATKHNHNSIEIELNDESERHEVNTADAPPVDASTVVEPGQKNVTHKESEIHLQDNKSPGHQRKSKSPTPAEPEPQKDTTLEEKKPHKEDSKNSGLDNKRKMLETPDTRTRKRRKGSKKEPQAAGVKKVDSSSDMSISPDTRDARNQPASHPPSEQITRDARNQPASHSPSEQIETPLEWVNHPGDNSRIAPELSGMGRRGLSPASEDIDDIVRRYSAPSLHEAPYTSNSHNWTIPGIPATDFTMRFEERVPDYMDRGVGYSHRNSFADDYNGLGRPVGPDPWRERPLYSPQANDDYLQRTSYSFGAPDARIGSSSTSSPYGPPPISSSVSAMDRYAPRLDETNYARGGSISAVAPNLGVGGMHDARRDGSSDPMGSFAPRPQYPYSRPGSSGGWLNH